MNKFFKMCLVVFASLGLIACGDRVQVNPAEVGKILTKDGYQEGLIPSSEFRLPACISYCDRLVTLSVADKSYFETLKIFIPEDKLNLDIEVRTTLSVNPNKTEELFNKLPSKPISQSVSNIDSEVIYRTYASQIIQTSVREYISKYSIGEIASNIEKINSDIQISLSKAISERTPYNVRYVGVTKIDYPKIITDAQEAAAERREAIQQEEAQLQISKVKLERELEEARLNRAIEKEKAETEALAQRTLADSVDSRVLELRKLEIQRAWVERWDGKLPVTSMGEAVPMVNLK